MSLRTLLIIDDEPLVLEKIESILADKNTKIIKASNGKEGSDILIANKGKIDCVICDMRMPEMNGLVTIKRIRDHLIEIPFIFYTSYDEDFLIKEAIRYGAYDFINKPHLDSLESCVRRGLEEGFNMQNSEINDRLVPDDVINLIKSIKE